MKSEFSTKWKSSSQARKQRKYQMNAPKHIAGKFLNAHLAKELRSEHKTRSVRVRSGDEVRVLRGGFKGRTGVVETVDTARKRLYIRGVDVPKRDGSKQQLPVRVSNVLITKLSDDRRRFK